MAVSYTHLDVYKRQDEHDAGGFLLGLLKQVADLAGTHTHEHLHELRAGQDVYKRQRHCCWTD